MSLFWVKIFKTKKKKGVVWVKPVKTCLHIYSLMSNIWIGFLSSTSFDGTSFKKLIKTIWIRCSNWLPANDGGYNFTLPINKGCLPFGFWFLVFILNHKFYIFIFLTFFNWVPVWLLLFGFFFLKKKTNSCVNMIFRHEHCFLNTFLNTAFFSSFFFF